MRPPGKYDALRQAEQQAQETREAPAQSQAKAELDSAQEEPTRPTGHPASPAQWSDRGEKLLQKETAPDWAKKIAEAAKERLDATQAQETDRGKER